MKLGCEVEGRFKGMSSIFLDQTELNFNELAAILRKWVVQQIYISDHQNQIDLESDELMALHQEGYIVTVERTMLEANPPEHVHVFLAFDASSFRFLNDTDEIKFNDNQHVRTCVVENMSQTHPEDFENDVQVS